MTTMDMQQPVTNSDAGYWVPTRTMFEKQMSSGELQKQQKKEHSKKLFSFKTTNVVMQFQSFI